MIPPHQATAEELLFNGDEKEAMVFYTRLMVEEPGRADLWLIHILYLIGQKQWTEAGAWISRAAAQFPDLAHEWSALRQPLLAAEGRGDEAWERLERLEDGHEASWIVLLSAAAAAGGIRSRVPRGRVCAREALRVMPPENFPLALLAGGMLEACGNTEAGLEFFRLTTRLRSDSAYTFYRLGAALASLGRAGEARRALLGAELLAGENMRLRKKIALLQPKSLLDRLREAIFG